jgi:hypothetical protein
MMCALTLRLMVMLLAPEEREALGKLLKDGKDVPNAMYVDVIRRSYPELWRQLTGVLTRSTETVPIEPGDQLLVRDDQCVSSKDKLIRRKVQRRDDDREPSEADAEPRGNEYIKLVDSPATGLLGIEWERPYSSREVPLGERHGRLVITSWDSLGSASELLPLRGATPGLRRELSEAFATRSVPVALNRFFGVRAFLVAPDMLLVTKSELHGTDRLQELLKNPTHPESEHLAVDWHKEHAEAWRWFERLRDQAFQSERRTAQATVEALPPELLAELLTAIAVPQLHNTIGTLLRIQLAFVQPGTMVAATLVTAGAALQPAWDATMQLRVLAAAA